MIVTVPFAFHMQLHAQLLHQNSSSDAHSVRVKGNHLKLKGRMRRSILVRLQLLLRLCSCLLCCSHLLPQLMHFLIASTSLKAATAHLDIVLDGLQCEGLVHAVSQGAVRLQLVVSLCSCLLCCSHPLPQLMHFLIASASLKAVTAPSWDVCRWLLESKSAACRCIRCDVLGCNHQDCAASLLWLLR